MTDGAGAVVRSFLCEGVDTVFGLPGGAVLPLYDALYDSPIRHVLVRHEQAAAHGADAYARATGRPGVCISTSGPGATNLITGLANALMDSVPLVAITGNVALDKLGLDAFQEADIYGTTQSVTKHNFLVRAAADLPQILKNAFHIARTGRPGPVLVDVPKDMFTGGVDFEYPQETSLPADGWPAPAAEDIRATARALLRARRPILYAGGGVVRPRAVRALRELAEWGGIPVTTTLMALGSFPHDHPLYLGMPGMHGTYAANTALSEADCLVAVGARFDDRVTGKVEAFGRRATIIHINLDPAEVDKIKRAQFSLVADSGVALEQLRNAAEELAPGGYRTGQPRTEKWTRRVAEWRRRHPPTYRKREGSLLPQEVIETISRAASDTATVVTGVGQHQMWTAMFYRFNRPRRFITSGGLGTMGFGLPAAVGAQVARPDEQVILIDGDGSFQMTPQELAVVAAEGLPIKMFIINNQSYGMVRQWQEMFFDGRLSYSRLPEQPDFVRLASAYGIPGVHLSAADDAEEVITRALSRPGPILVDCVVRPEEKVFPMVPPEGSLTDLIEDLDHPD